MVTYALSLGCMGCQTGMCAVRHVTLAIEPLLNKLRNDVRGLCLPNCVYTLKLSAYADDVIIIISESNDVNVILTILDDFKTLSSAKVYWKKVKPF